MSFVRLPISPLVTDKEVRDLQKAFAESRDRCDAEAAAQRAKYDAFWRAVGLIDEQPDTLPPFIANPIGDDWFGPIG